LVSLATQPGSVLGIFWTAFAQILLGFDWIGPAVFHSLQAKGVGFCRISGYPGRTRKWSNIRIGDYSSTWEC
jgi:hypothetical protein